MLEQITCPHCGKIAATIELVDAPRRSPLREWLTRNIQHTPKAFLTCNELLEALPLQLLSSEKTVYDAVTAVFGVRKAISHERQGFKGLSLKGTNK